MKVGRLAFIAGLAASFLILPASEAKGVEGPSALHRWETIQSFDLLTARVGWVETAHRVLLTTDAERRWRNVTPPRMHPPHHGELGVFFLDAEHGWILRIGREVGNPKKLRPDRVVAWRTADGGDTWSATRFLLRTGPEYGAYNPIVMRFTDALHGWAAIGVAGHLEDYGADIARTDDGGQSCSIVEHSPFGGASMIPSTIALPTGLDHRRGKNEVG